MSTAAQRQAAIAVEQEAREAFLGAEDTETELLDALDRATAHRKALGVDDKAVGEWPTERDREQGLGR